MHLDYPIRTYSNELLKEPNTYWLYKALTHYGEAIKAIINEQCGDGIMSTINFYCSVHTVLGKHGKQRVILTLNGKYFPFPKQLENDNTAKNKGPKE